MNHPSLKSLQDYFEAQINSEKISKHLEICDRCSLIVSQMAKVDILVSKGQEISVSKKAKDKVFKNAFELLKEKRERVELYEKKKEEKAFRREEALKKISQLRDEALSELQLPVLQSAALGVLLTIFTEVSTTSTEVEQYNIIDNETSVTYSEFQGELNEDS